MEEEVAGEVTEVVEEEVVAAEEEGGEAEDGTKVDMEFMEDMVDMEGREDGTSFDSFHLLSVLHNYNLVALTFFNYFLYDVCSVTKVALSRLDTADIYTLCEHFPRQTEHFVVLNAS